MKTYIFTYFDAEYKTHKYRVEATRFTLAYALFCLAIPSFDDVFSFSHSYQVISNGKSSFRFLSFNRILALKAIKDKCHEN